MSASIRIVLLAAALVLGGGMAALPTAEACGFEEEWHVGPVEAGLQCTRPYVEVHTDEILDPIGPL